MTETKRRCDHCGKTGAIEVRYDFVREPDGAGSMEINYKTKDLCHEMAIERLQMFLQEPPTAPALTSKEAFSRWAAEQKWKPV
jgi:hypothetical protein